MLKGAWRADLDGNMAGEVTAEQEVAAKAKIAAIKAKHAKRKLEIARANAPKRLSLADLKEAARRRIEPL
jgi:sRNA-binding protein